MRDEGPRGLAGKAHGAGEGLGDGPKQVEGRRVVAGRRGVGGRDGGGHGAGGRDGEAVGRGRRAVGRGDADVGLASRQKRGQGFLSLPTLAVAEGVRSGPERAEHWEAFGRLSGAGPSARSTAVDRGPR